MLHLIKAIGTFCIILTTFLTQTQAEEIWLTTDYVKPFKTSQPADQIIIGNPGIADVRVRDENHILLYGISPGTTNMFILDENGDVINDLILRVRAVGDNVVIFQRGMERTTYNCMIVCEPTVTIGDGSSFSNVTEQIERRSQQIANSPN